MELNLLLPVPTSLNKLYINEYRWGKNSYGKTELKPTGRRILSKDGVKCKNELQAEARVQMGGQEWDYDYTLDGYCYLDTVIYFQKRGTDDNNIYKLLCDALEKICYDNDSRILVRTLKIMYSPKNPRVEVRIHPVEYAGVFDSEDGATTFQNNCSDCSKYRNGSCSILKDLLNGTEREEYDKSASICSSYKKKKS
jgi:Holliday junction resolvase RusA-like endonuclease